MIFHNTKFKNMQFNFTLKRVNGLLGYSFIAFLFLCFLGSSTNAQTYVNGNLSTGATSSNAITAPAGYTWSEVQSGNVNGGFSASITNGFKLADNFVVPAGATWNLTSMKFYGYQTGYAGTVSPFTTVRVAIHSGTVTGPVVFGDQTTNRFNSSVESNIYRIFNAATGTTRRVWDIVANTNISLTAGTYWIEYATDVTAGAAHFLPSSTVVGTVTQAGNNAQAWSGTAWGPLLDGTNPQDLPFSVNYTTVCNNALAPNLTASTTTVCANSPVTISASGSLNNAANWEYYTGSCGGTIVGTGNSIVVNPSATTTYFVRGVGGCTTPGACSSITITTTPCTCLTPDAATICEGLIQRIGLTGAGTPGGPTTVSSGTISVNVPDATATGISTPLTVGLPTGASITSMSVSINMTHTWDGDMSFNLIAPNGAVYNLINLRGGSGDNFVNTTISSTSTNPIAGGTPPFTGTFSGDGAIGAGLTTNPSTVATFSGLYSVPSGTWRLGMRDHVGGDLGTLTSWSLTFNYVILTTASWTGPAGTLFSNAAATTPYVAGTQSNAIWTKPTVTSTYVATIVGGPCDGLNNSVITVLPRPVISVTPTSGCSPLTLTASGANTYAWTPSSGLNTTSGAVVIASPAVTTTYTVTGTGTNGCASTPVNATVNASPTAATISAVSGSVFQIQEGFTTVLPAGWARQNLSSPLGPQNWGQGITTAFNSFNGAPTAYAYNNFNATTGDNTISSWMFTPVVNIKNGDVISFYTRTQDPAANGGVTFPDRLELRMSTNGSSVNAGTTNVSVGDYTTLILSVNPALTTTGYPFNWTQYTATVSGVTGTVPGRFAFRYFVTNGGSGANSDNIGVDQVEYSTPSSANCPNVTSNLKIDVTGGVGPYTVVYSNGTTQTTINNYVSGSNIQVSPAVTTTYTIVSVTGANGCTAPANTSSTVLTITPVATITTQPTNKSICVGANTSFTVIPNTTNGTTYQWQVNTVLAPGAPVWTNITNGGGYSGATTATLNVTAATASMLGYSYRVLVNGFCGGNLTSTAATLTVVTPAGGTATLSNQTVCEGSTASFVANTTSLTGGPGFTHQFQVSTNGGSTFTNIANGGVYSGATSSTLVITGVPNSFNNYQFRDSINTVNGCGFIRSSIATLTVNPKPIVTISAAPIRNLFPGLTTTLTAAVSPNSPGLAYQWFKNGTAVSGAITNNLVVGIDALGTYSIRVTDANGCVAAAGSSTPGSIVIGDSSNLTKLFIYPSPNNGRFQVRYFNDISNGGVNPGVINVYDSKGTRVFSRNYTVAGGYQAMNVDLGTSHGKGLYRVDLLTSRGERIKTGTVLIF